MAIANIGLGSASRLRIDMEFLKGLLQREDRRSSRKVGNLRVFTSVLKCTNPNGTFRYSGASTDLPAIHISFLELWCMESPLWMSTQRRSFPRIDYICRLQKTGFSYTSLLELGRCTDVLCSDRDLPIWKV